MRKIYNLSIVQGDATVFQQTPLSKTIQKTLKFYKFIRYFKNLLIKWGIYGPNIFNVVEK